jgi:hypothetical protein
MELRNERKTRTLFFRNYNGGGYCVSCYSICFLELNDMKLFLLGSVVLIIILICLVVLNVDDGAE